MIEKSDIIKALEEGTPLLYDGVEVTLDSFDFLCSLSRKAINLQFQSRQPSKNKPYINVCFFCPICGKKCLFDVSKQILYRRSNYITALYKKARKQYFKYEDEIYSYIKINYPTFDDDSLDMVCDDCMSKANTTIESYLMEFYKNPLEWVNTHNFDDHPWLWERVINLYSYPEDYEKVPQETKYCGVKYTKGSPILEEEIYDEVYITWKEIKEKTIVDDSADSTKKLLNTLMEKIKESAENSMEMKTIDLAEYLIRGLIKKDNPAVLLNKVTQKSRSILEQSCKNPRTARFFTFGKYRDLPIHNIIEQDPEYIKWILKEIPEFTLTDDEHAHYIEKGKHYGKGKD